MNLLTIFNQFPDQEACLEHLEEVRFGDEPFCPHCGSLKVARKAENHRQGRWNCHDCHNSFNVLSGTIMQKTKVPLQKWFLAIGLVVNAKKSLSSCQLARDLDLNQKTAWYMQQRIRAEMASKQDDFLQGIVEADETYVGGKPRKANKRDDDTPAPRGRGTKKVAVMGAVERGGNVFAKVADGLSGHAMMQFFNKHVDTKGSLVITDEFKAYNGLGEGGYERAVINHAVQYVDGLTHTNTIEGFWGLLKRAWYGQHHHYKRAFMPLYIAESCWKYNKRRHPNAFGAFIHGCFA